MKKLLWLIVIVVALLIGAALAAPYFISADQIKGPAIAKVEEMTGKHLTIDGALRVKFFPVAGVYMEKVTLSDPKAPSGEAPLAKLQSLTVDVAVLPLLHKEIEVKSLALDEPVIFLHQTKDGNNWSVGKQAADAAPPEQKTAAAKSPIALPGNLYMNNVTIKNGSLSYRNDTTGEHMDVAKLNLAIALSGINAPLSIKGDTEWNGKAVDVKLQLDRFNALFDNKKSPFTASLKSDLLTLAMDGSVTDQVYDGKVSVNSSSLKSALAWLAPSAKLPDFSAPLSLKLIGDANCSQKSCSLTKTDLQLDKNEIKGDIKIVMAEAPQIVLDITTNKLDLNPYLPGEKQASLAPLIADAEAAPSWSDAPVDLSVLRKFNLTAKILSDGLVIQKLTVGKSEIHAKLEAGKLSVEVINAEFYSGKANITTSIDANNNVQETMKLEQVQAEPLLKDAIALDRISGGILTMDTSFNTHGASQMAMMRAFAGNGHLSLANAVVKGVNLNDMFKNVAAAFKLANTDTQKTELKSLTASYTIAQGIVTNNDLSADATPLQIKGAGTVNLPERTLDYRLTPAVAGQAQGGAAAAGLSVPVIIEGGWDSPSFRPDIGSAVQNALKNPEQLKNTERAIKQQLKNPQDAVKSLKGLLKGF